MIEVELPNFFHLLLGSGVFYALYCVYWELSVGAARRRMIKANGCQPASKLPGNDPILGLDLYGTLTKAAASHTFLESSQARYAKAGRTFQSNLLGSTRFDTIEPENLKTMQATKFKDWALPDRRVNTFTPFLGEGIFSSNGAVWQHSRELLRPNFTRAQVGDVEMYRQHVDHLIQAIPRDGSMIDLQDLFFRLTIDSATEFLFGESTNCLAPGISTESSARFAQAFNRGQEAVGRHGRSGMLRHVIPDPQFKKDTQYVHEFINHYVKKGLESHKVGVDEKLGQRYVFLHELVKDERNPTKIRDELLNILLAGRDTTASLLSNVWWMLARRPDVWSKLRAEVDQLDGEQPSFAQIKDMKYLRFVFNECEFFTLACTLRIITHPPLALRLHPVVPLNSRMATRDTVLPRGGGPDGKSPLFVPKKRDVLFSTYAMHRSKELYGEDAEEFKPERWEQLRPGWEYLPFNGGPRICLGRE